MCYDPYVDSIKFVFMSSPIDITLLVEHRHSLSQLSVYLRSSFLSGPGHHRCPLATRPNA